ncbi:response regulator [Sphingobacterium faecale]|uniref:Response regulator transcription factor n=1 Tax=Sphingobacterium faecale TaxID=2803775 RepID=A0ABS1R7P4_9SPHI|nr:response regulator transcription factor [Sphingobacterium faecale]MBL1410688.1 response regulator transcription factor [Sphingobacterium faecale]
MIRLVSIDDHRLFYEGLKALLDKADDMLLVNSYDNGLKISNVLLCDRPDIVLLDIHLPVKSGISIAREIKSFAPEVKIIMLSLEVNYAFAHDLKAIGVEAYVSKEIDAEGLLKLIREVWKGEVYDFYTHTAPIADKVHILSEEFSLTDREIEVYEYIKRGFTNQYIADVMNRSVLTIMTHRKNIKQKLRIVQGNKLPFDDIL